MFYTYKCIIKKSKPVKLIKADIKRLKSCGCKSLFKKLRSFLLVLTFQRTLFNSKIMKFSPFSWPATLGLACSRLNLAYVSL